MASRTAEGHYRVHKRLPDGRRVSKTFPTKILAADFEAKLTLERYQPQDLVKESRQSFAEFSEVWLRDYCKIEKAASQLREDESRLRLYLNPAFGKRRLNSLAHVDLVQLKARLSEQRKRDGELLSPKTINHALALAKKITATAVEWDAIRKDPFKKVELLELNEQAFDFWSAEERDRFLRFARHVDSEFAKAVAVAVHTGLRRGELAGLQRYQVDFDRRQIQVSAVYCYKSGRRILRTKNRKIGWAPMNAAAFDALLDKKLLPPTANIFGTELLRHAAVRFRRLCEKVDARPIRFHDLRHTFASSHVTAGVPLYTVQKLMRHETITMTERYSHLAPGYMREVAEGIVTAGTGLAPESLEVSSCV